MNIDTVSEQGIRELEARARFARITSPLGELLLVGHAACGRVELHGVYFAGAPHAEGVIPGGAREDAAAFARIAAELAEYFAGERTSFGEALSPRGTPFQRAVWRALAAVPYGETTTYGAIARAVGRPKAIRAVGAAIGRNPISILVPCHRVVGHDGALTGYAGGLPNKRFLLALESRRSSGRARARGGPFAP